MISSALCNTLGKVGIPYFTMPFNLVAICTFLSIKPDKIIQEMPESTFFDNKTDIIDWQGVGKGVGKN